MTKQIASCGHVGIPCKLGCPRGDKPYFVEEKEEVPQPEVNKEDTTPLDLTREELEDWGKNKLITYCAKNDIDFDYQDNTETLINNIIKFINNQ